MDAFYLDMRHSNDPNMREHAEDYNLMVSDMVQKSQQRAATEKLTTEMAYPAPAMSYQ